MTERLYILSHRFQYWHLKWEATDDGSSPPIIAACTKIGEAGEGGSRDDCGGGRRGDDGDDYDGDDDDDDDDDDDSQRHRYRGRIRPDSYATGAASTYTSRHVMAQLGEGSMPGQYRAVSTKQERNLFRALHPTFKDNYRAFADMWNRTVDELNVNGIQPAPSDQLHISPKTPAQLKNYADMVSRKDRNEQGRPITPPPSPQQGSEREDEEEQQGESLRRRRADDVRERQVALHRDREQVLRRRLSSGGAAAIRDPIPVVAPTVTYEEAVAAQVDIFASLPPPVPTYGIDLYHDYQQRYKKRASRTCTTCKQAWHSGGCPRPGAGRPKGGASSSNERGGQGGEGKEGEEEEGTGEAM